MEYKFVNSMPWSPKLVQNIYFIVMSYNIAWPYILKIYV